MRLPILFVGWSGEGSQINVYYPDSTGPEPFGSCVYAGTSQFWVHPARGHGDPMMAEVPTVNGHPGIFAIGDAPDGTHTDGYSREATTITICNQRLPADLSACPVRHLGDPAELRVLLTGSDAFVCNPCTTSPLIFELAPVVGGVIGTYVPHYLGSLVRDSVGVGVGVGVEKATIYVRADLPHGEYRLRVRNTQRPEIPPPLRVEFGAPVG